MDASMALNAATLLPVSAGRAPARSCGDFGRSIPEHCHIASEVRRVGPASKLVH